MHKFEIYDFDDFFNIYPLEIAPIPIDRDLYIERTENDYYRKKAIGILKNFVKMKVIEAEEKVKRIKESQKKEWKDKVELWNKKFQQMGIKIKNNVDKEEESKKEENKIINNSKAELKAIRRYIPAAFIAAYDYNDEKRTARACSGCPQKGKIHNALIKYIGRVGKIGDGYKDTDNKIGHCAEFHAVNDMLYDHANFDDIRLTVAFRVKYSKKENERKIKIILLDYCPICKKMFEDTYILEEEERYEEYDI